MITIQQPYLWPYIPDNDSLANMNVLISSLYI